MTDHQEVTKASDTKNLALQYLDLNNETIEDYCGICGELADGILHWIPDAELLYIERCRPFDDLEAYGDECCYEWSYHMVPVINGLVHCAWFPDFILPPKEYVDAVFCGQDCQMTMNDEEIE